MSRTNGPEWHSHIGSIVLIQTDQYRAKISTASGLVRPAVYANRGFRISTLNPIKTTRYRGNGSPTCLYKRRCKVAVFKHAHTITAPACTDSERFIFYEVKIWAAKRRSLHFHGITFWAAKCCTRKRTVLFGNHKVQRWRRIAVSRSATQLTQARDTHWMLNDAQQSKIIDRTWTGATGRTICRAADDKQ